MSANRLQEPDAGRVVERGAGSVPAMGSWVLAVAAGLAIGAALIAVGAGAAVAADREAERTRLADTERAFARLSRQEGMRTAFLAYLGEGAVIFRPGPVAGRPYIEARPSPPITLDWTPVVAEVAASGDLGYTTGPYVVRGISVDHPIQDQGWFVTLWHREVGGAWKVAVDQGVSTPPLAPADADALARAAAGDGSGAGSGVESVRVGSAGREGEARASAAEPAPAGGDGGRHEAAPGAVGQQEVLAAEHAFAGDATAHGARAAYLARLAPDARLYREGEPPVLGREAIAKALGAKPEIASSWDTDAAGSSAAGDLGFAYGRTALMGRWAPRRIQEAATYLRIWQRQHDGSLRIVLDLIKPLAQPH